MNKMMPDYFIPVLFISVGAAIWSWVNYDDSLLGWAGFLVSFGGLSLVLELQKWKIDDCYEEKRI